MSGGEESGTSATHPRAKALRITVWLLAAMFCLFTALLGVVARRVAGLLGLGLFSVGIALGVLESDRLGATPYHGRASSLRPIRWIVGAAVVLGVAGVILRLGLGANHVSNAVFIVR